VGWSMREGLILHTVSLAGRSVIHRASISEMVVPYGSPDPVHGRKNAFDMGEYGLGVLANSLKLGCDCVGVVEYIDGVVNHGSGRASVIPNAICIHEEDFGLLWKHFDWRLGSIGMESRRSVRLVVSFVATVGNYEYGFFWHFYLDGTIECQIKATGIVNTSTLPSGQTESKYSTLLSNEGMEEQIHQHYFCVRLDMCVDGPRNSVYEVNIKPEKDDKVNVYKNAFYAEETKLKTELEAQRRADIASGRFWKIVNEEKKNRMGKPVAWKLIPSHNTVPYAQNDSWLMRRAPFIKNHLWVTAFDGEEIFPSGPYPNQSRGGDGIDAWTARNRSLDQQDVVVWFTMGTTHVVRLEDWPVMPVEYLDFKLKPCGFFDHNPTIDLPPRKCAL